jgi:hypothetical protein
MANGSCLRWSTTSRSGRTTARRPERHKARHGRLGCPPIAPDQAGQAAAKPQETTPLSDVMQQPSFDRLSIRGKGFFYSLNA